MGGSRGEWVRGRCLGRGSTAAVYLAATTNSDPQQSFFAVKSAELSRSAPLQREQEILSSLCSPHVVSYLGSDVTAEPDGRVLYNLFMDYVPGGSLADAIKKHGGLDEHTIKLYTSGILNGLLYLHSRGIVHCDVKGHNILLGKDDSMIVKLADFGCARWVDDGSDGRGVISGTPLYMAPEVARGEEQGTPADIWALGCTVIEMATGCPPWRDVEDPVAAIHRIAFSGDVPELPCNISDDGRDFLGRCLNRDPRKRWSAEELLNHPFANCDEEFAARCVSDPKRNSPKSILDQDFWDSWQEDSEDEEEGEAKPHVDNPPPESAAQGRLQQLFRGGVSPSPAANVTRDESCWITIRDGVPPEDQRPSTSGSHSAEEAIAAIAGYGGWSSHRDDSVAASMEGFSPPCSPSHHFYIGNNVINSLLHEGDVLVNIHNFCDYLVSKREMLANGYYDYDICDRHHRLLQEIKVGCLICAAMLSFAPWSVPHTRPSEWNKNVVSRLSFAGLVF